MPKAKRDLKVHLELTENEACDIYIHLEKGKYVPNCCDEVRKALKNALGYEPLEAPQECHEHY